jgi:chemotaxis protein MotA
MTILGSSVGFGVVFYVLHSGDMTRFLLNPHAIILIFGGTIGSVMISFPWSVLIFVPNAMKMMFFPPKRPPPQLLISTFTRLAEKARREGIDSLASEIAPAPHPFLADGLQMLVDGLDPEVVRDRCERDILVTRMRHAQTSSVFKSAGTFAPIFGLLGTLVGVVGVLKVVTDMSKVAQGMAIAMTASFYGIFSANFIFLPVANKLTFYSDEEVRNRELILRGILALQAGEAPWLVAKKLEVYLAFSLRRSGARKYRAQA